MEPTKKSSEMEQFLNNTFGRTDAIVADKCVPPPMGCGQPATNFKDQLSEKEYRISGLCQNCQDSIFGG